MPAAKPDGADVTHPHRGQPNCSPAPHRRDNTVYECPNCETRLLGVQRREDCGTFTRRLGLGGHCPDCDEPVTIDEVLDP